MLQCSGLVAIPSEAKLEFVRWNDQGFFANFNVFRKPMFSMFVKNYVFVSQF